MPMVLKFVGPEHLDGAEVGLDAWTHDASVIRSGRTSAASRYGKCRPRRAAELVAAQFDTVAATAEECDAPVATGVMPTGVWR